eukprot:Clim_evm63s243 gene=Clim_evmTU63s243
MANPDQTNEDQPKVFSNTKQTLEGDTDGVYGSEPPKPPALVEEERNKMMSVISNQGDGQEMTITLDQVGYTVPIATESYSKKEKLKSMVTCNGMLRDHFEDKALLSDVSAVIKPGTLTAIMGPSGAGKSTLLDVISARKNQGIISGDMQFNKGERPKNWKRLAGYVEQTDVLLATLTVRQTFYYAARLKIPKAEWGNNCELIDNRVNRVIEMLGLESCADTIVGSASLRGISGGQAKRVNIGIELITFPSVLFLDEPTTGLDSQTAYDVMLVVKKLAAGGRTVLATIHQPSPDTYRLFDSLLLLVLGETVYNGPPLGAVKYLEDLGYQYPTNMNPADFIIAVTGGGTGHGHRNIEGPEVQDPRWFAQQWKKSSMAQERAASQMRANRELSSKKRKQMIQLDEERFSNSRWTNFVTVLKRYLYLRIHDPRYLGVRFTRVLFMAFLIATFFKNQGTDSQAVYNLFSVFNFTVMNFSFGALGFLNNLIEERKVFVRERNAATYQVFPYYMAQVCSEIPFTILQVILWTIIVYFSVDLRSGAEFFFTYMLITYLLGECGLAMVQTFSALADDFTEANFQILPVLMISFIFAGFYIRAPEIPDYWIWAYYISYIGYGLNALGINQFDDNFSYTQDCIVNGEAQQCPWDPDDLMSFWGVGPEGVVSNKWYSILILALITFAWRTMVYLMLRFKKHGTR